LKFFNKHKLTNGGIDTITPSRISGWVCDPNIKYTEVKLTHGDELIASTYINEGRQDVVNQFSVEGKPGFTLMLPSKNALKKLSNAKIRIFAINSNCDKQFELKLFKNPKTTIYSLQKILNSEVLGRDGFIDGIQYDGKIHGWAGLRNSSKAIDIWMACGSLEPIQIKCDKWRAGLENLQIGEFSGFNIDTNEKKYNNFRGQEVRFYFDKECRYEVPHSKIFNFPNNEPLLKSNEKSSLVLNQEAKKNFYANKINSSKGTLRDKWKFIEKYSSELDNLELEIKANKALKIYNKNIFKRIFFSIKNK